MRALRTLWATGAVGLVLVAAGSCGVPDDDEVRTIDDAEVPYHLLDDTNEIPAGTTRDVAGPRLYWVDGQGRLVGRPAASVCSKSLTDLTENVLDQLGDGPSDVDLSAGLGTALPPEGWLELVAITRRTAHLRVSNDDFIATNRVVLAAAQTVLSLTSIPGVDRVKVEGDAEPLQVPRSSGELADGPLRHDDYRSLLADPAEPPKEQRLRRQDLCPG